MKSRFNLQRHTEFYAKHGWTHDENCLCRRSDLKQKEVQKLKFTPTAERFEEPPQQFKNINN